LGSVACDFDVVGDVLRYGRVAAEVADDTDSDLR
jgi:hypothetical protein